MRKIVAVLTRIFRRREKQRDWAGRQIKEMVRLGGKLVVMVL